MRASVKRAAAPPREPVEVTPEELAGALELLRKEEASAGSAAGHAPVLLEIGRTLASVVGIVAFPLGLLIVFLDAAWGLALLAAGFASLLAVAVIPRTTLRDAARSAREAIDPVTVKAALDLRERRVRRESMLALPLFLAIPVLFGVGLLYLVYGLIDDGEVNALALLAIAISVLLLLSWGTLQGYLDYRYFSRVLKVRTRLQELADDAETEDGMVAIAPDHVEVLGKAETQQIERAVKAAVEQAPEVLKDAWGLSIESGAQEKLKILAEERPEDWQRVVAAILELQSDPIESPESDHAAGEGPVQYVVDEHAHIVRVLKIDADGWERPVDA